MKRIAFTTLGCKANWCDTQELADKCRANGLEVVPFDAEAQVYVVNTCTVTSLADHQSRQTLRKIAREHPDAAVIATGCLGEMDKAELEGIKEVHKVFGTHDRDELVEYVARLCYSRMTKAGIPSTGSPLTPRGDDKLKSGDGNFSARARAFLKIQDGCARRCTYCVINRARGKPSSMPPDEVLGKCRALSAKHREIVLTGIDIVQYGSGLTELLEKLVSSDGISRVRISTIPPTAVDDRLIGLLKSGKLCRHIHLSMQSLSDGVLARMGRWYKGADAADAARMLTENVEGIAVTGDIIAGFPAETEDEHGETMANLSSAPFAGLHVFPFSPRRRTPAEKMAGQVPSDVKKKRAGELRMFAREKRREFLKGLEGQALNVIVTSREPDDIKTVEGFSDNAVTVVLPSGKVGYSQMGSCRVVATDGILAKGEWV